MRNRIFLVFILLVSCFAVSVFAQTVKKEDKPNFSGTWILDDKKSGIYLNDQKVPNPFDCDTKMTINYTQTNEAIVINFYDLCREKNKQGIQTKETKKKRTYFLDKRGENNTNILNEIIYSETEIKKSSLVIKEYKTDSKGKKGKLLFESAYLLSKDGKTLNGRVDYYTIDFPNQMNPIKQYSQLVYKLKE